jgi:hypothetical protein
MDVLLGLREVSDLKTSKRRPGAAIVSDANPFPALVAPSLVYLTDMDSHAIAPIPIE